MFDPKSLLVEFTGDLCMSGGARGSDAQWGMTAGSAGHSVIHWSYEGHKVWAPETEVVRLSKEQLEAADVYLHQANKTLQRTVPTWKPWLCNLLRRNYYQVSFTGSLYGIGEIDSSGLVKGGTSWAVQMYLDRFSIGREDIEKCLLYFYDQPTSQWFKWGGSWQALPDQPPAPSGLWTGIGTRDLEENGKNAIRRLMQWKPFVPV